jgi:hypothetical protein
VRSSDQQFRPDHKRVAVIGDSRLADLLVLELLGDRSIRKVLLVGDSVLSMTSAKLTRLNIEPTEDRIVDLVSRCDFVVQLQPSPFDGHRGHGNGKNILARIVAACAHAPKVQVIAVVPACDATACTKPEFNSNAAERASYPFSLQPPSSLSADPTRRLTILSTGLVLGPTTSSIYALSKFCSRRSMAGKQDGTRFAIAWDEDVAAAVLHVIKHRIFGHFRVTAQGQIDPCVLAQALEPHWTGSTNQSGAPLRSDEMLASLPGWHARYATAEEVLEAAHRQIPARRGSRWQLFFRLIDLAGRFGSRRPELLGMDVRIAVALTGRDGGEFGVIVSGGRLLTKSSHPSNANAYIALSSSVFRELLLGQNDWISAQATGRFRSAGNAHAILAMVSVTTIVRTLVRQPGMIGYIGRGFISWLGRGGR